MHVSAIIRRAVRFTERIWVRAAAIASLAVLAAGLSSLLGPLVPKGFIAAFVGDALDRTLDVLAGSMLAATVFSLTVMVSIHRSVSSQWSPRAHRLLVADRTTMTVVATFVGAWVFSVTGIILRRVELVSDGEATVLFAVALLVVVLIVVALVRWTGHLEMLGSLTQVGDRIERETRQALRRRIERPCLGGRALVAEAQAIPPGARAVRAEHTGWLRHIYEAALQEQAEAHDGQVFVVAPVDRLIHAGDPVAFIVPGSDEFAAVVLAQLDVGAERSFEQDPRFGLVVLSEIASKALSPGINDPGTAIEVIARLSRALEVWRPEAMGAVEPIYPRLWVRPLEAGKLLEDAFAALARDGANALEVQLQLQRALGALMRHPDDAMAAAARRLSQDALRRAEAAMDPVDFRRLREDASGASVGRAAAE